MQTVTRPVMPVRELATNMTFPQHNSVTSATAKPVISLDPLASNQGALSACHNGQPVYRCEQQFETCDLSNGSHQYMSL